MMETPRERNLLHFIMKAAQSECGFHLSLTIFLSVLENDIHREFSTTRPYTALYPPWYRDHKGVRWFYLWENKVYWTINVPLRRVLMQDIACVINLISIWILLCFIYENIPIATRSKKFGRIDGSWRSCVRDNFFTNFNFCADSSICI